MPKKKLAWKEARRGVDLIVALVRRMDGSCSERKLSKSEYAMMIGVLMTASPAAEATYTID